MSVDRDHHLVEALRLREPMAVERLVGAYGDQAYRLAVGLTGSAQDAEEIVQDASWAVARKIDTFRGDSAFGSWFYRIVANAAFNKLRHRRARRREISLDDMRPSLHGDGPRPPTLMDSSPNVEERSLNTELRGVLTSAIDALPADYRTALVLHDVEGLSSPEIARTLRISLASAKSRVHRARLALRKRLSTYLRPRVATRPLVPARGNAS
jgi:RNA polymerase sigma-70 factor, ECF subfamily